MQPVKIAQRFQNIQPSGMLKIFQAAAAIDDLSNLGIGEPDFHTEPKIVDAAAKALDDLAHHIVPGGEGLHVLGVDDHQRPLEVDGGYIDAGWYDLPDLFSGFLENLFCAHGIHFYGNYNR